MTKVPAEKKVAFRTFSLFDLDDKIGDVGRCFKSQFPAQVTSASIRDPRVITGLVDRLYDATRDGPIAINMPAGDGVGEQLARYWDVLADRPRTMIWVMDAGKDSVRLLFEAHKQMSGQVDRWLIVLNFKGDLDESSFVEFNKRDVQDALASIGNVSVAHLPAVHANCAADFLQAGVSPGQVAAAGVKAELGGVRFGFAAYSAAKRLTQAMAETLDELGLAQNEAVVVTGAKGGVGKSFFCRLVVDYIVARLVQPSAARAAE